MKFSIENIFIDQTINDTKSLPYWVKGRVIVIDKNIFHYNTNKYNLKDRVYIYILNKRGDLTILPFLDYSFILEGL